MLKAIIFDYNRKFIFNIWESTFKVIKIKFLILIAYYLQISRQSKKTNWITEIILKYLIIINLDKEWDRFLLIL